jgi:hypothetical protein
LNQESVEREEDVKKLEADNATLAMQLVEAEASNKQYELERDADKLQL